MPFIFIVVFIVIIWLLFTLSQLDNAIDVTSDLFRKKYICPHCGYEGKGLVIRKSHFLGSDEKFIKCKKCKVLLPVD